MAIQTTLDNYKSLGDYFAPDYEQDNEVLSSFKRNNLTHSKQQTTWLIDLLKDSSDITDKHFGADLPHLMFNFQNKIN